MTWRGLRPEPNLSNKKSRTPLSRLLTTKDAKGTKMLAARPCCCSRVSSGRRWRHGKGGTRCKHSLNSNSIKMYDKQETVLRIETTINDPRDMKAFRTKEGDPEGKMEWSRMRKGVCDLQRRSVVSQAANSRCLESLASVKHAVSLGETLKDLCKPVRLGTRRGRAMKPFDEQDTELLAAISHGEFAINGFRNKDLQALIHDGKPHPQAPANPPHRQPTASTPPASAACCWRTI